MAADERGWLLTLIAAGGGAVAATVGAFSNAFFGGRRDRLKAAEDAEAKARRDEPHDSAELYRAKNDGYDRLLDRAYERIDRLEERIKAMEEAMDTKEKKADEDLSDCEALREKDRETYAARLLVLEDALREMGGKVPPRALHIERGESA